MTPENFGRIAAQTAKQVILQRIREAEREMMYDEYIDRVGEVVTGDRPADGDRRNVLVDLGKVEALLPGSEQVDGERYEQGSRIKAVIREVRTGTKGPQVILSRRDPELIKTLFELEVPEIADGLVEIRGVAREPGYRSKIAVESHAQGVDPVGACVGPRGSRVRMVVSELRGEKIDIIPWNNEPARFVAKALSPARVREVYLDDEASEATVVVPDDQLALAIGKEGMNARLAARLTGWKIDITSRDRVRTPGGRRGLRRRRARRRERRLRPLRRRALERQALPERRAARFEVLRRSRPSGALPARARRRGEPRRRGGGAGARAACRHRRARGRDRGRSRVRRCRAGGLRRRSGDAPVAGEDVTLDSGAGHAHHEHVEDDPNEGIPIEEDQVTSGDPVRTCAGCGRKASQSELQRFHDGRAAASSCPGAGSGPRRLYVPAPRVLRPRGVPQGVCADASRERARRPGSLPSLHLIPDGKRQTE